MHVEDIETRVVVLVSGCFDLLHSGHVAFFETARSYGTELHVAIGSDCTVTALNLTAHLSMMNESDCTWAVAR
jgi:cytidyltransferase-like protein